MDLTFFPLTATSDDGTHWSAGSLIQAGLAEVPDALAATPGSGPLLALTQGGIAEESRNGGADWTQLATGRSLAASAAGRRCGLTALTAVSFTPTGVPLVAGTCERPSVAGIFAWSGETWQAAGPAFPASLAGQATEVLRLTSTPAGNAALLVTRTGTLPACSPRGQSAPTARTGPYRARCASAQQPYSRPASAQAGPSR